MSGLPRQSGGPQQLKTGADVLSGSPISPQPSSAQLPPSNEILLLRTRLQELEKRAARTPTLEQHQQLEAKLQDLEHKLKQLEHKLLEETQSQSSKSGQEVSSASQPAASALYPPLPRVSPSPAPTAFAGKKAVSRVKEFCDRGYWAAPKYEISTALEGFVCTACMQVPESCLPNVPGLTPELRKALTEVVSEPCRTHRDAKDSAAQRAVELLQAAGLRL